MSQYQYTHVGVDKVAANKDEYIIPELQEACMELWARNLFTFMCSNLENGEDKYILVGKLSEENTAVFQQLMETDPEHYKYMEYYNRYEITNYGSSEEALKKIIELIKPFKMQDVLEGYQSVEAFLVYNFGIGKYDEETLCPIFDETKMTKTVEEYLEEAGVLHLYDSERGIVYDSEFYRDAHFRYLEYVREGNPNLLRGFKEELGALDLGGGRVSNSDEYTTSIQEDMDAIMALVDMQLNENAIEYEGITIYFDGTGKVINPEAGEEQDITDTEIDCIEQAIARGDLVLSEEQANSLALAKLELNWKKEFAEAAVAPEAIEMKGKVGQYLIFANEQEHENSDNSQGQGD